MDIRIHFCRYMGRTCTFDWEQKYTRYGMCYSFNPDGGPDGGFNPDEPEKVRFYKKHFTLNELKENSNRTKSSLATSCWFQPIRCINWMV